MQHSFLRTCFWVFITTLIYNTSAYGQNTDSLHYDLDLQIGGQRKTGVFSQNALRVTSTNKLEKGKVALNNFSSYTYTQVNGGVIADDWDFRTIVTYRPKSNSRILPAVAHNFHSNVLYRMRNSNRGILGLRFIPFKKVSEFTFLIGGGYERSNYNGDTFSNSKSISDQRSFTLGFINFTGRHKFGKSKIAFNYNLSLVQSTKELDDFSLWYNAGFSFPLAKSIALGINYELRYRNVHLEMVPNVNDLLIFNLRIGLTNKD